MNHCLIKYFAVIMLLFASQAITAAETQAREAAFSFDSVWFYRDGTKVIPEIGRHWLTVAFDPQHLSDPDEFEPTSDTSDDIIRKKAKAIIKSHDRLVDYLYDPNIAENTCFFWMRAGLTLEEIHQLINQISQDGTIAYVHPTLELDNKTFAYFNTFELEWKTGTPQAQRESLLGASHAERDEQAEKDNRYLVDVAAISFFRALNLLAEDIRVLRVKPDLVEIKSSIKAKLSLFMSGGNIGDSIPFTLTIFFSDRVSIDPSSIATLDLRPPELQKELFDCIFDPYDYAKAVTKSPIVITGRLRFYAPGEFTIPSLKISYSCPSCPNSAGSTVRSIETKPVLFKVSSIIPADQSANRLIVPTDPVSADFHLAALRQQSLRYRWLAIICFAGLVPCAAWMFYLRRKASSERDRHKERKRNGQLAEQLRTLLQATPPAPHWGYLAEVGSLLRDYLVSRYGIDPKYTGGSGKQFMETITAQVPEECFDSLSTIFSVIDTSVALEAEHYQDIEQLQHEIMKVVELITRNGMAQG